MSFFKVKAISRTEAVKWPSRGGNDGRYKPPKHKDPFESFKNQLTKATEVPKNNAKTALLHGWHSIDKEKAAIDLFYLGEDAFLKEALKNKNKDVRIAVIIAAGKEKMHHFLPELKERVLEDKDEFVRARAACSLFQLSDSGDSQLREITEKIYLAKDQGTLKELCDKFAMRAKELGLFGLDQTPIKYPESGKSL